MEIWFEERLLLVFVSREKNLSAILIINQIQDIFIVNDGDSMLLFHSIYTDFR